MNIFVISMILSVVGAILAIVTGRSESTSKALGSIFGIAASACALWAGGLGVFSSLGAIVLATPFSFAEFTIMINPLSGLLLIVINLLALVAWIYGLGYLKEYTGKGIGVICFFMNLFIVSMNLVITVDNAFWFLVFFEIMSLTSYFLVIVDQDEKSTKGGFLYLIMAHIGFLMIMIAFFVMASVTGSLDFASFRATDFGVPLASLVFILAFLGFGCKAGMIPFHSWLPQAHPAAPSHVSALMSGGMIKIGIFGIVKVGLDLLAQSGCELWWGIVVLLIGAISSVLGVVYALAEHDIKRLLAYHSVENIGIILLGVGIAFIGVALNQPVIAGLGLMAGLYHLVNHAMFKGLLFLGAGSVLFSTHTRDMEKMGGLVRAMPVTAMCFLIGSLAISAIPPLNGFVSEWFTYQSMFTAAFTGDAIIKIVVALAAVSLAMTGALAVTCFVKAYGVTFLGAPRSDAARKAVEVPASMKVGMVVLAAVCICLGIGAPWVAPVMQNIAESILMVPGGAVVSGLDIINPSLGGVVSTPLLAVLLIALTALPLILRAAFGKGGKAFDRDPWACGYLPDAHMPMNATSFGASVNMFLRPLYSMRSALAAQSSKFVALFNGTVKGADKAQGFGDTYVVDTIAAFVDWLSLKVQRIEGGNFRVYITYIVVALVVFLILAIAM